MAWPLSLESLGQLARIGFPFGKAGNGRKRLEADIAKRGSDLRKAARGWRGARVKTKPVVTPAQILHIDQSGSALSIDASP